MDGAVASSNDITAVCPSGTGTRVVCALTTNPRSDAPSLAEP